MNSKIRPRGNFQLRKLDENNQFYSSHNSQRISNFDSPNDSADSVETCHPLREISYSSVTEFSASYLDDEPNFSSYFESDFGFFGCDFDKAGSDSDLPFDNQTDSFVRLQEAGLVRLRTRQIEARLRRKITKRKRKISGLYELYEVGEHSSFPCQSTSDVESFIHEEHSAGTEIKIHLRRQSLSNIQHLNLNRRRPTSDPSGLSELLFSKSLHHPIYQTV